MYLVLVPKGSKENPAQQEIELTTAPSEDYSTHWGQQVRTINLENIFCVTFITIS